MDNNACSYWDNIYTNEPMKAWYSDGTKLTVDLVKVKKRLTELEKEIIKPYVIDKTD